MPEPKPEGEAAHALAEKLTSEPMIVVLAIAIFLLVAAILEWEDIFNALAGLFSR